MLGRILIGVAIVVVLLVIVIASRPGGFRIERSITINASPPIIFAQVNDFHAWTDWSPWDKLDPNLKRTYESPTAGIGAMYSWVGNNKVGKGWMTIEKSDPAKLIAIKLEFIKPFTATNEATFTFEHVSEGTKVTWAMEGCNGFSGKAFSLFMNMDKMVGGDFERGLAAMKTASEAAPAPTASANAGVSSERFN